MTPDAVYPPVAPDLGSPATLPFAETDGEDAAPPVDIVDEPIFEPEPELLELLKKGLDGLRKMTPRTLEACAEEGLEPSELLPRTVADFAPNDLKVVLSKEHQLARHERFEQRRRQKLADVVRARRRLLTLPSKAETAEDRAAASMLVQERQRRAAEQIAAMEKQIKLLEDQKNAAAETAAGAAAKAAEADKRLVIFERERQAALKQKLAEGSLKRELQTARIDARRAEVEAELAQRAADAEAHEAHRVLRIEAERKAQEHERHEASLRKLAKAEAARQEQNTALEKRKETLEGLIANRQVRVELHAAKFEAARLQSVKDGIERHRKNDDRVCEADRLRDEFQEKTKQRLEAKGQGSAVRDQLNEQRQRAQAQRGKAVAAARLEVERARDKEARQLVQSEEKKEHRRQNVLASRAGELAGVAEKRRAKVEEIEDRVRRQTRKREYERERMRAEQKAEDAKFFAQKAALEQLHQEKLAQKHKMEALGQVGPKLSMREIEQQAEPGPTNYDNRFFTMGQLGPGGKYARVGTKPAPPAHSFGSTSENALPRVLDKALMIELVGQVSPGPNTAHSALGSREVLDKSGRYPRSPSWTMSQRLFDPFNKESLAKPGPGDTAVSDRQMELTRYNSAPAFSFSTSGFQELRVQELKALASPPKTAGATPTRERYSFRHSSRQPGPCTYDHGNVQTSLRIHRNLADGVGVSQRFNKADRFLPIDTTPKDTMGPTTYAKSKQVPGPQKYRPSTSYLSTPLAF